MDWYVFVQDQAYGPYTDAHMQAFVTEGRIVTSSLICNNPAAGYYEAHEFEQFHIWNGTQQNVQTQTQLQAQVQAQAQPQLEQMQQPVNMEHSLDMAVGAETVMPYRAPAQTNLTAPQVVAQPERLAWQLTHSAEERAPASKIYLVMAEIRSGAAMTFLKTLQDFGTTERVGETVWLVRSSHTLSDIRNRLSHRLDQQDRLFLLDTKSAEPAWFNIGADLDHRIRELWDEDHQG